MGTAILPAPHPTRSAALREPPSPTGEGSQVVRIWFVLRQSLPGFGFSPHPSLPPLGGRWPEGPDEGVCSRLFCASHCHASPARDARLPFVSGLKQARFAVLRFLALAAVHPRCSRRLRASHCHAARPPRRHTAHRCAENAAGFAGLFFDLRGSLCACSRALRASLLSRCGLAPWPVRLPSVSGWSPGRSRGPALALATVQAYLWGYPPRFLCNSPAPGNTASSPPCPSDAGGSGRSCGG